ncbi:hypothetical protein EON68_04475 [archaeon]|nr:MAG: hypothetical protein EON68_04475 [archaeon]
MRRALHLLHRADEASRVKALCLCLHPQRRALGAHALSPVLRRKSLISADALAGGGGGTPTSPSSAPSTVAQTLQQLFKYYSLFGDRESDGTSLRSSQFAKMMKDAGLLSAAAGDGSNVTAADVDVAFSRYVAMGTRMRFDAFISACNELAALYAHGREGGAIGIVTSGETDATTLRSFIMDILVPLHASVQSEPLFIMDVLQVGADDYVARFADEFARPDVLGFLSDHRSSLMVRTHACGTHTHTHVHVNTLATVSVRAVRACAVREREGEGAVVWFRTAPSRRRTRNAQYPHLCQPTASSPLCRAFSIATHSLKIATEA